MPIDWVECNIKVKEDWGFWLGVTPVKNLAEIKGVVDVFYRDMSRLNFP